MISLHRSGLLVLGAGWLLTQGLAAVPAFPIKASANGRYLVDAAGIPFLYHADTVWALPKKATLAVADEYFARRVRDGFTAVHLHAVSKEVGPVTNLNGDEPFTPLDDILKPNEVYWRHLDAILESAEKHGLVAAVSALWIRWGGQDREGWRNQLTETNARIYGEFLGKRYRARQNIVWILGGDANPKEKAKAVSLLAQGLRATAPHHLITVHNAPENSSASQFGHEPWLDLNATYTYREVAGPVLAEWNRQYVDGRPRPIFLIESGYERESNDQRAGTPFRVRRQAYAAVLSGALAGHAYGHRELWRFSGQWREAMNDPGSRHMAHVKALFAGRAWWRLVPDQKSEFVTAGRGEPGKDDYVTAACASDNTFAIAYLPSPHRLTLNLGRLARPTVDMFWFDPTSGQMTPVAGKHPPNLGEATFFKQDKNAAGDSDWVLLAEPR